MGNGGIGQNSKADPLRRERGRAILGWLSFLPSLQPKTNSSVFLLSLSIGWLSGRVSPPAGWNMTLSVVHRWAARELFRLAALFFDKPCNRILGGSVE